MLNGLSATPLVLRPGEKSGNVRVYSDDFGGSYVQLRDSKVETQFRLSRKASIELALAILKNAGLTIEQTVELMR